jgi:hypothetical protein
MKQVIVMSVIGGSALLYQDGIRNIVTAQVFELTVSRV